MMVAIPLAPVVQRHDKQVGLLQELQNTLTFAGGFIVVHHSIAQRSAHTLQDGGVQQEALDALGLEGQNFTDKVIRHVAVVSGKALDEISAVAMPL